MKSVVCLFSILTLSFALPAAANPELARSWSEEARVLKARVTTSPESGLSDDLMKDLERFGRVATRLSASGEDTMPLPEDLACIFRGMAEETNLQLDILNSSTDPAALQGARQRLAKMLEDAAPVGQAAAIAIEAGNVMAAPVDLDHPGQCGAVHPTPEKLSLESD
ncbi:MAG: hypothetical protein CMK06_06730 [Ponticaulis sp.]|nr:hypothetical protein [Ponticaulis sp.]